MLAEVRSAEVQTAKEESIEVYMAETSLVNVPEKQGAFYDSPMLLLDHSIVHLSPLYHIKTVQI